MRVRPINQSGSATMVVVFALLMAIVIGAVYYFPKQTRKNNTNQAVLLHKVEKGDFEAFITEPGEVASSSNVEIKCLVKSHGSPGTAILKICKDGIRVKKGDLLIQFDDSLLQNQLLGQKIVVANDETQFIQANNNLENAKRTLTQYTEGLYAQEHEVLESQLYAAQAELERSSTRLEGYRELRENGFISAADLRAEEFTVEKSKRDLSVAKKKLDVYKRFTRAKMIGGYEAEIKKQQANVQAATSTLELSRQREIEIKQQISNCKVLAPADGQVVYANDPDRRGDPIVIKEGAVIRENQVVIRLPDFDKMQVDVKINESHYKRVNPGNQVRIELDADPEHSLKGKVKEIAKAPFPVRWHGAPIEYGAVVTIIDPPSTLRPNNRAKVKITFESRDDVLQVPLAAIIEHKDRHYCLVREDDTWRQQLIKIGPNNNDQVIVEKGLKEGDQVSMTPFRFIERTDLPDKETDSDIPSEKPGKLTQSAS